mgnify:FL=1
MVNVKELEQILEIYKLNLLNAIDTYKNLSNSYVESLERNNGNASKVRKLKAKLDNQSLVIGEYREKIDEIVYNLVVNLSQEEKARFNKVYKTLDLPIVKVTPSYDAYMAYKNSKENDKRLVK